MKKLIYVAVAIVSVSGVCEGMVKTLSFHSPTKLPLPCEWPERNIEKPSFFHVWNGTIDIDRMLKYIEYNMCSADSINKDIVSRSFQRMSNSCLDAISLLFYAEYAFIHSSHNLRNIVSSFPFKERLKEKIEEWYKSYSINTFSLLLDKIIDLDQKYKAQLAVALFESQFSNKQKLRECGYNSNIVYCAIEMMNDLGNSESFLQEAARRLNEYGIACN